MLGYIIPPIVIVLSLASLIFFLFRKSAKIPEELIMEERRKGMGNTEPQGRKLFRFTQLILQITEKVMQRFKLFSLKFYNKTDNWFHSIKEKREQRSISDKKEENVIKVEDRKTTKDLFLIRRKKEARIDNVIAAKEEKEIEVEPMISKEAIHPDSKIGVRNEFEKALIERIAFNPKDIEAYERLGDYYIEIGNFNDSLSCFEEVLKLSPGSRKAKIKMRRLQKIVFSNKL